MPGLEMPIRGGGAAMLRELRDEERPSLDNQETLPETELGKQPDHKTDQSYDNMTNNLTDKKSEQKEDKKSNNISGKQNSKPVRQSANQSVVQPESQMDSQNANQSVADMIRRRAAQRGEQEVLKTVTLKLSPALDERVEQYCFDNKMKKQEFWAEAAALYFEMIAQGEES